MAQDPLHGITLERIVTELVDRHGWGELGRRVPVRCFLLDPSIKSSLTFLRRTPWARKKVEDLYLEGAVTSASSEGDPEPAPEREP
jgi:uncharacterized protein (DUF2132 family)